MGREPPGEFVCLFGNRLAAELRFQGACKLQMGEHRGHDLGGETVELGVLTEANSPFEQLSRLLALDDPVSPSSGWFAPRPGINPLSQQAHAAAADYGRRFECEFKHYCRLQPAI